MAAAQAEHPEWRSGQTHFNVLYVFDPKAATAVEDARYDPFYVDEVIPYMRAFLRTYWQRRGEV